MFITNEEFTEKLTQKKIDAVQSQSVLRMEIAFKDIAHDIFDCVPEGPERTRVLNHLLDAKLLSVNAIVHPPKGKPKSLSEVGAAKAAELKKKEEEIAAREKAATEKEFELSKKQEDLANKLMGVEDAKTNTINPPKASESKG